MFSYNILATIMAAKSPYTAKKHVKAGNVAEARRMAQNLFEDETGANVVVQFVDCANCHTDGCQGCLS